VQAPPPPSDVWSRSTGGNARLRPHTRFVGRARSLPRGPAVGWELFPSSILGHQVIGMLSCYPSVNSQSTRRGSTEWPFFGSANGVSDQPLTAAVGPLP